MPVVCFYHVLRLVDKDNVNSVLRDNLDRFGCNQFNTSDLDKALVVINSPFVV